MQFVQEPMQEGKSHLREWQKAVKAPNSLQLGQDSPATSAKALSLLCRAAGGKKDFPAT